jgi:hypothetical protein
MLKITVKENFRLTGILNCGQVLGSRTNYIRVEFVGIVNGDVGWFRVLALLHLLKRQTVMQT